MTRRRHRSPAAIMGTSHPLPPGAYAGAPWQGLPGEPLPASRQHQWPAAGAPNDRCFQRRPSTAPPASARRSAACGVGISRRSFAMRARLPKVAVVDGRSRQRRSTTGDIVTTDRIVRVRAAEIGEGYRIVQPDGSATAPATCVGRDREDGSSAGAYVRLVSGDMLDRPSRARVLRGPGCRRPRYPALATGDRQWRGRSVR